MDLKKNLSFLMQRFPTEFPAKRVLAPLLFSCFWAFIGTLLLCSTIIISARMNSLEQGSARTMGSVVHIQSDALGVTFSVSYEFADARREAYQGEDSNNLLYPLERCTCDIHEGGAIDVLYQPDTPERSSLIHRRSAARVIILNAIPWLLAAFGYFLYRKRKLSTGAKA